MDIRKKPTTEYNQSTLTRLLYSSMIHTELRRSNFSILVAVLVTFFTNQAIMRAGGTPLGAVILFDNLLLIPFIMIITVVSHAVVNKNGLYFYKQHRSRAKVRSNPIMIVIERAGIAWIYGLISVFAVLLFLLPLTSLVNLGILFIAIIYMSSILFLVIAITDLLMKYKIQFNQNSESIYNLDNLPLASHQLFLFIMKIIIVDLVLSIFTVSILGDLSRFISFFQLIPSNMVINTSIDFSDFPGTGIVVLLAMVILSFIYYTTGFLILGRPINIRTALRKNKSLHKLFFRKDHESPSRTLSIPSNLTGRVRDIMEIVRGMRNYLTLLIIMGLLLPLFSQLIYSMIIQISSDLKADTSFDLVKPTLLILWGYLIPVVIISGRLDPVPQTNLSPRQALQRFITPTLFVITLEFIFWIFPASHINISLKCALYFLIISSDITAYSLILNSNLRLSYQSALKSLFSFLLIIPIFSLIIDPRLVQINPVWVIIIGLVNLTLLFYSYHHFNNQVTTSFKNTHHPSDIQRHEQVTIISAGITEEALKNKWEEMDNHCKNSTSYCRRQCILFLPQFPLFSYNYSLLDNLQFHFLNFDMKDIQINEFWQEMEDLRYDKLLHHKAKDIDIGILLHILLIFAKYLAPHYLLIQNIDHYLVRASDDEFIYLCNKRAEQGLLTYFSVSKNDHFKNSKDNHDFP